MLMPVATEIDMDAEAQRSESGEIERPDLTPVDPADLSEPEWDFGSYDGTNITASSGCHQCC